MKLKTNNNELTKYQYLWEEGRRQFRWKCRTLNVILGGTKKGWKWITKHPSEEVKKKTDNIRRKTWQRRLRKPKVGSMESLNMIDNWQY